MTSFHITNNVTKKLEEYFKKAGVGVTGTATADFIAKKAMGLQMINWIVNGSPRSSVTPPVKDTYLRGAGSVHVGSQYVGGTEGYDNKDRNYEHSDNINTVTIGFNAIYTAIQHERLYPFGTYFPGPISMTYPGVGGKFVEQHINADAEECVKIYAEVFKKETGA